MLRQEDGTDGSAKGAMCLYDIDTGELVIRTRWSSGVRLVAKLSSPSSSRVDDAIEALAWTHGYAKELQNGTWLYVKRAP